MRYLIKYTKESEIKFISHLDLMRTLQKIVKRADLPIEYSNGFNPHMAVSIAQPLSVGSYSSGEYMDVVLNRDLEEEYILRKMKENTPRGIKILDVVRVIPGEGKKKPQAMAIIDAAKYTIKLKCTDGAGVKEILENLRETAEWNIVKKTKSGEKMVNIKSLVHTFDYKVDNFVLCITALVCCGSRKNLSSSLLADFMKDNIQSIDKDAFVNIRREEMYAYKNEKLVTLSEFFKI
ncbi:TIGR03936 family radical SAM-associated protein [Clostridium sp.]|uniref:TIGR03936 family radical SAM-associated protein n=1 Tax=Clostridium sp. TaxID=1506 RepID=UPI003D6D14AE